MRVITKYLVVLLFLLVITNAVAQKSNTAKAKTKVEVLEESKNLIPLQEKEALKQEVEAINKKLARKEISLEESKSLKEAAANKRALNIENRLAIIDNRIALLLRNEQSDALKFASENRLKLVVGAGERGIWIRGKDKPVKYEIKTSNDLLFAFGLNTTLSEGQGQSDAYDLGMLDFVELGWNWKTRIFKHTEFFRLKYGFSFQWNKLDVKNNDYFALEGNQTLIENFPKDLEKAKFRVTNLVFPVYLEMGPLLKLDRIDRIRFVNNKKPKIGLGGYLGFNLSAKQKLFFNEGEQQIKQKISNNYNVSRFVYGLGAYIGVGDISLYAKYDLSPLFKHPNLEERNFSLGFRIDLD